MQLMPRTARSMNVTNAFDPNENVDAGVRHLKSLLENYNGNLELSLAAYNAGSKAVDKSGGIPRFRETQDYVKKITGLYLGTSPFAARLSQIHASRDSDGHLVYSNE
jgi:soluble lytic murein transglycosylase-like protein